MCCMLIALHLMKTGPSTLCERQPRRSFRRLRLCAAHGFALRYERQAGRGQSTDAARLGKLKLAGLCPMFLAMHALEPALTPCLGAQGKTKLVEPAVKGTENVLGACARAHSSASLPHERLG
jgi:hypothetical protein